MHEFKGLPQPIKFERVIDDFVFLTFFVGNDFLPSLPNFAIREGGLDALIYLYKLLLPKIKGYLTKGEGELNFTNIQELFKYFGYLEEEFY